MKNDCYIIFKECKKTIISLYGIINFYKTFLIQTYRPFFFIVNFLGSTKNCAKNICIFYFLSKNYKIKKKTCQTKFFKFYEYLLNSIFCL